MQLGADWEELAIRRLSKMLEKYERCYGERGGRHDEHTRTCAHLLQEAYKKVGNASKAQEIEKRYSLQLVNYIRFPDMVDKSRLLGKLFCAIILFLLILVLIYLRDLLWSIIPIRKT